MVNGENFKLELFVNDERRQIGNTKDMIHSVNKLIAHISQVFSLSKGDIIFTGTPEGVSRIVSGDKIKAVLNDEIVLNIIAE